MLTSTRHLLALSVALLLAAHPLAHASPSVFPETAVFVKGGFDGAVAGSVGAELALPVPFIDASAGLEAFANVTGDFEVRLEGSALVFPALGFMTPALAVGVGADLALGSGGGGFHLGPMVGSDLLFAFDLPITVAAYLAPGYASDEGLSLAWALQVRYYLDDVALEVSSTDLLPLAVGVRLLF